MKETDIKKSFQAYKTIVDAWTDVGHELVLLYESQGAVEEARIVNNRIGAVKATWLAREKDLKTFWALLQPGTLGPVPTIQDPFQEALLEVKLPLPEQGTFR